MDRWVQGLAGGLLLGALTIAGNAAIAADPSFSSGSTGADGAFSPTCSPTPCTVAVALPPSGVFNFTTITIPSGVTVTFTKNAANTPAALLATGNVTINGTLSVSGGAGGTLGRPGPGGPGGFDGGPGADGVTVIFAGSGLGPGGGTAATSGASYATEGVVGTNCSPAPAPAPTYGSPALRPILGGSGGAGGGGGGALIVASTGTITVSGSGQLVADGGVGVNGNGLNTQGGGGGSGGAIRLIATTISSSGNLYARGGNPGYAAGGHIRPAWGAT